MPMTIRPERSTDRADIRRVNLEAFGTVGEADLVEALRANAIPLVSLVAEDANAIVGHILFSPVTLSADPHRLAMGLAPMAVTPARQRQGIGSALVTHGLAACRQLGSAAVVVLGHPTFYPRFGFVPGSRFGLTCEYDVPDDVFMARELRPDAFTGMAGLVRYHDAFSTIA